ncbi:MAG: glycosyltransferase [Anaerolineales bacterium]
MRILWIPHAAWRIPQRANLFCRALSKTHEVHVTDWAADYFTWRDYLTRRYLNNFSYRLSRDENITVHGIPRISPALYSVAVRRWNAGVFSVWVDRIIRRYRIDVVVGTFVVRPPIAPRLVFDLFDDNVALWRQYGSGKGYAGEIESTERAYLQFADMIVAASSVLAEKAGAVSSRPVRHIPNGVNLDLYKNADGTLLRTQWNVSGSIVGMLGNHDKPAELMNVLDTAKMLIHHPLTFIVAGRGSAVPEAKKRALKEGLTNVKFTEEVAMENAAEVVGAFDMGLCTYAKTPADDARSPMRLLMYAAAGLPTVCTDLEEVRRMQLPNVIRVEDNPQAYADGILRARRLPRSIPKEITAYDLNRLTAQYEEALKG